MLNNFMYEVTTRLAKFLVWLTTGLIESDDLSFYHMVKYYGAYFDMMDALSLPIVQIGIIIVMLGIAWLVLDVIIIFVEAFIKAFIECRKQRA